MGRMLKPSGPFHVGTLSEVVESANGDMTFNLRVYFPCDPPTARKPKPVPYFRNGALTARAIAGYAKLPWFVFDHLVHVRHSITSARCLAGDRPGSASLTPEGQTGAKVAHSVSEGGAADDALQLPSKLPLVMFSHGLGGVPDVYLAIMQDLASQVRLTILVHYPF